MNSCDFIGRLTRDPEVRYSQGEKPVCITRFTLAVDKPKGDGAFYLAFKALGARGEFAEKHLRKGQQIGVHSRAESGSYEKDGNKVYFTEFIVEGFTFCGKKENGNAGPAAGDGFMDVPDGYDEELPFN